MCVDGAGGSVRVKKEGQRHAAPGEGEGLLSLGGTEASRAEGKSTFLQAKPPTACGCLSGPREGGFAVAAAEQGWNP